MAKKKKRTLKKKIWLGLAVILLVLGVSSAAFILMGLPDVSSLKASNPTTTALIRFRQNETRRRGRLLVIHQDWVPFDHIPDLLKEAVRVTEDFSFYWHKGIDLGEIKESFKRDLREGRFARGGSTITQQLAKNLYLSNRRSILRKVEEYFIARRLEKALSKERIFEIYLNVIELGPGIFGVEAAARNYFHKAVDRLDSEEIVRLTAVIPRPLTADPRGSDAWVRWRCGWILGKLKLHKIITEDEYDSLVRDFE